MLLRFGGIPTFDAFFYAIGLTVVAIIAIRNDKRNRLFKGSQWQREVAVTVLIIAFVSYPLGPILFPVTIGIAHVAVWSLRKAAGGDKKTTALPIDEGKIGSPF